MKTKQENHRSARMLTNQIPVSPHHLGYFNRNGGIEVQVLVMSARCLMAKAQREPDADAVYDREEFTELVRQLMAQRQLSEEILEEETGPCEFDCEFDELREILEGLCRETESVVLAGQIALARAAGEEELAAKIESLLA
jgi:hypothetical protein